MQSVLYTAEALATGDGRNGHVATSDGRVDLDHAFPVSMRGDGEGANPEELFAAGYAACYHNAVRRMAREAGIDPQDTAVGSRVHIGRRDDDRGYELAVELEVVFPGVDHATAVELANKADEVCPYSNATRGNITVTITVVGE